MSINHFDNGISYNDAVISKKKYAAMMLVIKAAVGVTDVFAEGDYDCTDTLIEALAELEATK